MGILLRMIGVPPLVGKKFNKLTAVKFAKINNGRQVWLWACDCGRYKEIELGQVRRGITKGCGCYINKNTGKIEYREVEKIPELTFVKSIIKDQYKDLTIDKHQFYTLCQEPCAYCGLLCVNERAAPKNRDRKLKTFNYNGLDRIDVSKNHELSNIAPCCKFCNWAKMHFSLSVFLKNIYNMYEFRRNYNNSYLNIKFEKFLLNSRELKIINQRNNGKILSINEGDVIGNMRIALKQEKNKKGGEGPYLCECKCGDLFIAYHWQIKNNKNKSCGKKQCHYKSDISPEEAAIRAIFTCSPYLDGNLTLEIFYALSQMNCVYCNQKPMNATKYKWRNGHTIYYNGLDRVSSKLKHMTNNVVPCCQVCNKMKSSKELPEFDSWLTLAYNNLFVKNNVQNILDNPDLNSLFVMLNNPLYKNEI